MKRFLKRRSSARVGGGDAPHRRAGSGISLTQSDFLNLARWVAALLVVAEHTRNLIFLDFDQITNPGLAEKLFYFLTGFGREAVMVFFVISGYLVGGKVLERMREGRFHWRRFLCDRTSRLYSVLVVALLIGWALDSAGANFFNDFGLYSKNTPEPMSVIDRDYGSDAVPSVLVGNLLFLQTISVSPFGSNGPLWSLANEWWYYLLFPICLRVGYGASSKRWLWMIPCGVLVALLPTEILILFGIWLMGVMVSTKGRALIPPSMAVVFLWASLVAARIQVLNVPFLSEFLVGLSMALMLISLAGMERRLPLRKLSKKMADFSYTTYLLHFPLLLFVVAAVHDTTGFGVRMRIGAPSLMYFLGLVSFALILSWIVSLFTEAKTSIYRALLYRTVGLSRTAEYSRSGSVAALSSG